MYHCCSLFRVMAVLTKVSFYQTTWHHILGRCNIDTVHQETPISHKNDLTLGYVYIFTAVHFFNSLCWECVMLLIWYIPVMMTYFNVVCDYITFIIDC
jgi:hypothetical protein